MSATRHPDHGVVANVTSDGQGHYVVFHQQEDTQAPPLSLVQQQQQPQQGPQRLVSLSSHIMPPTLVPSISGSATSSRPRILTRPGTIGITPARFSSATALTGVRKTNSSLLRTSIPIEARAPNPPQLQPTSVTLSPQVVTILDDEESESCNYSTVVTQPPTTVTIYPESRRPTPQDSILTSGTVNYTTLTSVENFQQQMNNIYMETLPTNLDASTVIMGSDNQLYNIQNNGETVLFCPSSVSEHGSINLLPLIDSTNSGTSAGQIHFPIGDVMSGNGVFELIALPSDSSITSFSDQPILNLANAANYGTMIPISQQQDPNTQYVFSVHDENGMATMSSVTGVLQQNATPLSVDNSSVLTFTVPTSTVTTMAPSVVSEIPEVISVPSQQPTSQRTFITVVDDFSDLIKTEDGGNQNPWGFGSLEEPEGISFGMGNSQADSDDDSSNFDSTEDPGDSITEIHDEEGMEDLSIDETNGASFGSGLYEQIQAAFNDGDIKEEQGVRVMVDGEYFEEVKPMTDGTINVQPSTAEVKLEPMVKTISHVTPITLQNARGQQFKIGGVPIPMKGSIQIRARSLPVLAKKPPESDASSIIPKNLNDYTTITLRNSMEKANSGLQPTPVVVEKPKPKVPVPLPANNRPGIRNPAVPVVDWVNGVGKFPGLSGKICVDDTTGTMEVLDYNPAEHQRRVRVPFKIVKEQHRLHKKTAYAPKPKTISKPMKPAVTTHDLSKIKSKTVIPATGGKTNSNTVRAENTETSSNAHLRDDSDTEKSVDVTFCVTCGTLATKEEEFTGRSCKKCIEAEEEEEADDRDESPATKFKIPKGITIVKTSKRLMSQAVDSKKRPVRVKTDPDALPEQSSLLDGKKNQLPVLKLEPPTESVGITVIPIFQTPSLSPKMEVESDESSDSKTAKLTSSKRRKYRRSLIEQRKLKTKSNGRDKVFNRKRTLQKVLNTKTRHAKKSLMGSGSSISDAKSPGLDDNDLTDSDASSKTSQDSNSNSTDPKKVTPLIDFNWSKYLHETNSKGAPPRFFRQPAFPSSNPFKIGMMMEAVDPQHQSLFCVANVVDVQGYRIRLHLTGYSEIFDFWVNADSYDIFPTGWCAENNHDLQPPPNYEKFSWAQYLRDEELIAADSQFFAISSESVLLSMDIQVGMKLEAVDIRNMSLTCVATVQNIINDRLLIHFDSWDCIYDYWTDTSSPFIHPVGYCKKNGIELTPPKNYKGLFQWESYLKETNSDPVPSQSIRPLPPIGFKKGMKLECVDKRNPFLIRVSTIAEVEDHQLLIHFDGWSSDYDFNVYECSGDIHPIGWCAATGHPLQVPPDDTEPWAGSCSVFGCLGVGHIKGYKFMTHNAEFNCPYSPSNLKKDFSDSLPDRFLSYKKSVIVTQQHENSSSSRRGSMEAQTTFQRAAKLRSEKRKSLATEIPVVPAKRKYTKRKSEAETLMKAKGNSSSEGDESKEKNKNGSLLLRRLSVRQSKSTTSSPTATTTKIPPVTLEPIPNVGNELPKRIVLPNIESTITPVLPPTIPGGASVQVHWEDILDSVSLVKEKKGSGEPAFESSTPPEFSLPSSTTMTPIPTPGTTSALITTESFHPKSPVDHLLMICSQKGGGELTISQCSNDSFNGESGGSIGSKVLGGNESDTDLPLNFAHNIKILQGIVGKLNTSAVSKWKTKNVVGFVRKIPGCLDASQMFDEHQIDGEAFLLMTMTDFSEIMGLKMGPSIKLIQAIRLVQNNSFTTPLPAVSITPIPTLAS